MQNNMVSRLAALSVVALVLVGCAGSKTQTDSQSEQQPSTLESFNRSMFNFNYNVLDPYVLRPVAVAWRDYLPVPARTGISNVMGNLDEPSSMVNYLLEGDVHRAAIHFTRFFLNSTLGLGGLIDVAGKANPALAPEHAHSFGSTLGHYGVGYGPYVELPAYGSFTPRQDGGAYVDTLYPPISWLTFWMSAGKWALQGIETRAQLLDSDGMLRQQADPYSMLRSAYFQRYDFLANGGKLKPEDNDNVQAIQGDLKDIDSSN